MARHSPRYSADTPDRTRGSARIDAFRKQAQGVTLPMEEQQVSRWRGTWPAISAAAAHLPENVAYGLMALAPLGPVFGPQAMLLALVAAVLANAVGATLGGGGLVGGPRASLALLTAGFVAAVVARLDATGLVATPWIVLLLLAAGLLGAGLLQVAFGLLRLGDIVKYTPHPVRQGVTSGVGLLLALSALPVLLGQGFGSLIGLAVQQPLDGAMAVGLAALSAAWLAQQRRWPVPPLLLGLVAGAALQAYLQLDNEGISLSRVIGVPSLEPDWLARVAGEVTDRRLATDRTLWTLVAAYAATAAVLCSLDTLLTVSVVDGRLRRSRPASRELMAQGVATAVAGCAAGMATSPSIARSLALLDNRSTAVGVAPAAPAAGRVGLYTIALAAFAIWASPLLAWLPESAVGGVLMLQGLQMVSPALWRMPLELWRGRRSLPVSQWRMLGANWAVAGIVACNAILLGLGPAVLLGASFAVLLFVRANMRDVVRREWSATTRRSLKTRPAAAVEELRLQGGRITLLEMQGSLFFGTADALRERLQILVRQAHTVILDLHQVSEVDITGARILLETAEDWRRQGLRLVFAEWDVGDPRRLVLEAVAGPAQHGVLQFVPTADAALEAAEDALLATLGHGHTGAHDLTLADTLLGHGLDERDLALLQTEMTLVRFAPGERLFALGDPGDALYVSLRGDIGLRIPGSKRRLASFAPGVTIGEMAVLLRGTRSAEAVAETEVVALRLSAQAFDRMMVEQPVLAARLLRNLTLHLADRVRVLTGDLAHWVARASVVRPDVPQAAAGAAAEAAASDEMRD